MRCSILLCLFAVACSDPTDQLADSGTPLDATPDAGVDAGVDAGLADAQVDAGLPDTGFDAGHRDAAAVDAALSGTSLENIRLEWTDEVRFCDVFQEGTTLQEAIDQKMMVVLPPQTRSTLEPGDLGTLSLERVQLDRSPFAADQWTGDAVASTLTRWETFGPADATQLYAEIVHDLSSGETLVESLSVTRNAGDERPVVYGEAEVGFRLELPNGGSEPLVLCGGPPDLETAVYVLSATDGAESLTIIREQNTSNVLAGTAPVFPTRAEAQLSTHGYWGLLARGHWAQVYTAEHHNWDEKSQIRFDHDLPQYYRTFGPYERGELTMGQPVRTIQIEGVLTGGNMGTATVIEQRFSDGAEISTPYAVEVHWTRVDEIQLGREASCGAPNVETLWTVGNTNVQLQVVRCNGAVETVVPIYFPADVTQAGARLAATQIGPVATVSAGNHTIQIDESGFSAQVIVLDGTGAEITNASAYPIELFELEGSAQRTTSGRNGTDLSAEITRQAVAQGVGNSTIYAPVSFSLTFGGETHSVRAWDRMIYGNTHHNWDDTLEAETDELRLFWSVFEFGQRWRVRAVRKSDGTEVLPSTVIQ